MNARQKAKRYKKELDALKSRSANCIIKPVSLPTEHFKVSYELDNELIFSMNEEDFDNNIRLYLAKELANAIKDRLNITTERSLYRNTTKITSDIFVSFVP